MVVAHHAANAVVAAKQDYMHARYYNPTIARFLSVDPADVKRATLPQSWNKYAYARNNPLRLVDPDGRVELEFVLPQLSEMKIEKTMGKAAAAKWNRGYQDGATLAYAAILAPTAVTLLPAAAQAGAVLGGGNSLVTSLAGGETSPMKLTLSTLTGMTTGVASSALQATPLVAASSAALGNAVGQATSSGLSEVDMGQAVIAGMLAGGGGLVSSVMELSGIVSMIPPAVFQTIGETLDQMVIRYEKVDSATTPGATE